MENTDRKYDTVIKIIENPENYTASELEEILSDAETREIYNLLCKTESASASVREVDIDKEWKDFAHNHGIGERRIGIWRGSRAAAIALIATTAIAAIAAGIAITASISIRRPEPSTTEETSKAATATAATHIEDTTEAPSDSVATIMTPVMFEDASLEEIMKSVAVAYGVKITFRNRETASLHLYYSLDPALPLDEIISQLNTFEQINIRLKDDTLTIE